MRSRWTSTVVIAILVLALAAYFGYTAGKDAVPDQNVTPSDQDEIQGRLEAMNLLLLGIDARSGEAGRTDTIMVIGYHPDKDEIAIMSIPRDTRVKIKGGYDKINAAYVYGGAELAVKTVEEFSGIELDHYAVVDFNGFERLVDLVGGIEVDVPVRMYYQPEGIDLQPGKQTLNGADALAFSRYRGTSGGDLDRAERQQQVLALLTQKMFRIRNVIKLPQLLGVLGENVTTDVGPAELARLVPRAAGIQDKELRQYVLPGVNQRVDGLWYYLPDEDQLPEIRKLFE